VDQRIVEKETDAEKQNNQFRNYEDSINQDRVSQFYYQNHKNQTLDFVLQKKKCYSVAKYEMGVWDAVLKLNDIVDNSDPDTSLPQLVHLLQTAEAIRSHYPGEEYDWFHLTGFIHDLGKVLTHPEFYNEPQWAVVGDTFPVGCAFSPSVIFYDYFKENPDYNHSTYSTKYGIYQESIGLDNVHFSWGHDEYLYQVCTRNGCTLPEEALYTIRYHSFYAYHQNKGYDYLANDKDREMLKWVKEFQKCDLYSKMPEQPNMDELLGYYKKLIQKYFPAAIKW